MYLTAAAAPTTKTGLDSGLGGLRDFFHSTTWHVLTASALILMAGLWIGSAYWVHKDAKRRIDDRTLVATAAALGLVPPLLGPFLYLLFRPPEYRDYTRERTLQIRLLKSRLGRVGHCPTCRTDVEPSFLVCPVCITRLRDACTGCGVPLESSWRSCPLCETAVPSPMEPAATKPL